MIACPNDADYHWGDLQLLHYENTNLASGQWPDFDPYQKVIDTEIWAYAEKKTNFKCKIAKYNRKKYNSLDLTYGGSRIDKKLNVFLTLPGKSINYNTGISLTFRTMYNDYNVNVFDYHRQIILLSINFGM